MKAVRKNNWNTYCTTGYTYDAANDQASAGGVHLHQIRKTRKGWQKRILQSNGQHQATSPIIEITDDCGEKMFGIASGVK